MMDRIKITGGLICPYCGMEAELLPDPVALTIDTSVHDGLRAQVSFISRHRCGPVH